MSSRMFRTIWSMLLGHAEKKGIIPAGVFGTHQMATTGKVDFLVSLGSCEDNFTTETLNLNDSFTDYAGKGPKVGFWSRSTAAL